MREREERKERNERERKKKGEREMSNPLSDTMPQSYLVCMHADCLLAETCLHRIAFDIQKKEKHNVLYLLNPDQCTRNRVCPHYRDCKPVRFARGFTNFQRKMLPGQYYDFMYSLRSEFGRTGYFERRRGDVLLSPAVQTMVLEALKASGVEETWEFDAYEERVNWE